MNCNYLDQDGKAKPMIMGCYGIGVGRAMAAVCEQCHDDYGPVWPMSIAPFQVELIGLNINQPEVRSACDALYEELLQHHVEVLYDDRGEKAGFSFADADLIGAPLRVVISPKTLANGVAEFKRRDWGRNSENIPLAQIGEHLRNLIDEDMKQFQ
jgi:prolyl-tRNA synthetase